MKNNKITIKREGLPVEPKALEGKMKERAKEFVRLVASSLKKKRPAPKAS